MKAYDRDYTQRALEIGQVGIWYGAWSATDFHLARQGQTPREQLAHINEGVLHWPAPGLSASSYETAVRFSEIAPDDWVVLYWNETLYFTQLEPEMHSDPNHELNLPEREVCKYRNVSARKEFRLSSLPDAYRLIPAVGRANVHAFLGTRRLVEVLGQALNENQAVQVLQEMLVGDWLELLGPSGWESICLGYLMRTEGFVPTGLMMGRTLATFDIVGRRWEDGTRVLGQCKKDLDRQEVAIDFLNACELYRDESRIYYFAYGGCINQPPWLNVVSRDEMLNWLQQTADGRRYFGLLRGHQVD